MHDNAFDKWASNYKKSAIEGSELLWPSETLVRLFKGDYIPGLDKNYSGKKVVEIGFGNGNNLIFLATLGFSLNGSEIHEDICNLVKMKLAKLGIEADLKVGNNTSLPFSDNEFDYLVSWNVLHYEDNEEGILKALQEYCRILKPGGRFLISTTGPEHNILMGSTTLGGHRYLIGRSDDFRKGQVYFYFDTPNYIHYYFSKYFKDVLVGRIHDFLFTGTLDWFIVTGIKGA